MNVLFVMIGGFFGAIGRYLAGEWVQPVHEFPLGTLLINLIGCFFLGWFLTFVNRYKRVKPEITLMIGTGVIGSFTTFSTFSVETVHLFQGGHAFLAVLYVLVSTLFGLLLADAGRRWALSGEKEGVKG
ncbi:membrane protein [Bacillus sp. FJAT-27231]|uniref:fluoride efflux transporter CrcB n=1 Tax=Bacillus sp. FJAT-27231 TaxID=1679168 RepID=UPI000671046F|nr:fluoride efflux transporter CrcB [Bacillus sp. FJAT-27231]KMY55274.1 membrane protein [Bacillus sp. FJAT-27231]